MLYSAQGIAKHWNLPGSTTRFWISEQYRDFIEPAKGKKHTEATRDIIGVIKELREKNQDPEQIKEHLRTNGYTEITDGEVPTTKALALPQQATLYRETFDILTKVVENQERHLNMLEQLLIKFTAEPKQPSTPKEVKRVSATPKKAKRKAALKKGEWSKSEVDQLKKLSGKSLKEISSKLNRTPASVNGKALSYNKKKSFWQPKIVILK